VEKTRGGLVLPARTAVREVAARDHKGRFDTADEFCERRGGVLERGIPRAEMEIGHVEDACRHRRSRLQ
jgi:hypothetical protein